MDRHFDLIARQGKRVALLLALMGLFNAYDLYVDWLDNDPLFHIIGEFLCSFVPLVLSVAIWRAAFDSFEQSRAIFEGTLDDLKSEAARWKADIKKYASGISSAIDAQFDRWRLTPAEKEVGLLLVKGLSYLEIAGVRETSERTVREQSSAIFKKSGVSGRAQLAAFFLEDLLSPSQSQVIASDTNPGKAV